MRKFVLKIFTILLELILLTGLFVQVEPAYATTVTFNYTGAEQTWVVPAGVTSIAVDAYGAGASGLGGRVEGILAVTPGETLRIYVGGTAGFNGGGAAGSANGGGATDIRQGGTGLANRVAVAGGGGGGSGGVGGAGGAATGAAGGAGGGTTPGGAGQGGTQVGGGTGGTSAHFDGAGVAGQLGQGGTGGGVAPGDMFGGGGGGGYYGGGGGGQAGSGSTGGGGGGGSNYVGGLTGSTSTRGYVSATGNGQVIITVLPTVVTSAATSVTNSTAVLNGTSNPNGTTSTGWFRYATTSPGTCDDTFGTRTSGDVSLGSGSSAVAYSKSISGLTSGTTYYVCAISSNSGGTSVGTVQSFTVAGGGACSNVPTSGNYTASSSCIFSNSTFDGVDAGTGTTNTANLTLPSGYTLTVGLSQTVAYGSITKPGAAIVKFTGGVLQKGPLWIPDADSDGSPDAATTTGQQYAATQPAGYTRRSTIPNGADCNTSNAYVYQNISNLYPDADVDGYNSGVVSGSPVCVGAATVSGGKTYYPGIAGTLVYMASASASVGPTAIAQKGNCVVLGDGTVQCWGSNSNGQLGIAADSVKRPNAVTIAGISGATAVASSDSSSCALITGGTIKCWGSGTGGQLGNGSTADSATPVSVTGITTATQISGGSQYYCARLADGSAKCWGNNDQGRLADGGTTSSSTPVTTLFSNVTQIEAGSGHTCALISDGTVQCIGYNYYGQLGSATSVGTFDPVFSTAAVSGISGATKIANYGIGNCALSSGSIKCWGYGDRGTRGNGVFSNSYVPVSVSGISTATDIMNNSTYVMCAILSGGGNNVRCWGYNGTGGVGAGTVGTDVSTPQTVSGITASSMGGGRGSNCAITTTGELKCWGYNANGDAGIVITTNTGSTTVSTHVSSFGVDCNDADATKWRNVLATDNATDADSDGWTVGAVTSQCIGNLGGLTLHGAGSDCYDGSANAKPGQTTYFTTHRGDGSYDYNCDSAQTVQYPISTLSPVGGSCQNSIPTGIMGPTSSVACGGSITQVTSCFVCTASNCGGGSCSTTGPNLWTGPCSQLGANLVSGYATTENIATRTQDCR